MASFQTLDGLSVRGKRVLVRADLNVPMKDGRVADMLRIERQAPTIKELSDKGAMVIVLSHFDRPNGKVVPSMSLKPVTFGLAFALSRAVGFAENCIGPVAEAAIAAMNPGDVLMLENTRFHAGEEANDAAFARQLAALGDVFVNDAFSAAHRAHASTEGLAHLLPSAAGRAMEGELFHLHQALDTPRRPVMAVVGGAKVSTKIQLLENLLARVDTLVIGGAMANTFLAAKGIGIGKSLYEPDHIDTAKAILKRADETGAHVLLPEDVVVATEFKAHARHRTVPAAEVAEGEMILDVGPDTIDAFVRRLESTATLVWNGPFGAFETQPFDRGTVAAARAVAMRSKAGKLLSVAGGGDTVAALNHAGVAGDFSYVSTAGGAFLEWLEGQELPGVRALAHSKRS
ncbi:MAG TPA: phosphoglycerate kinase [Rhizomicrobium sp.]|nr:phosphoglycerate kinase [Rhizomicrobium sp.]